MKCKPSVNLSTLLALQSMKDNPNPKDRQTDPLFKTLLLVCPFDVLLLEQNVSCRYL
jgi:hypothetical protein